MRPLLFFSLLMMGASWTACEKSTAWELTPTDESRLVVEAVLTNENSPQEVFLSGIYPDLNGSAPPVMDAEVSVESPLLAYSFSPDPARPGRFVSDTPFAAQPATPYVLRITWEDDVYKAESELSKVLPIPSAHFISIPDTNLLILGDFIPAFSPVEQAYYQVDIHGSHLDTTAFARARLYYYTFSSLDMSQLVPPGKETVTFPVGSEVIIQKFGLDEGFANYLRAKAIETDWSGSFFFGVSDNLPTNLSGDALGYFGVCAVRRDTLIAE